MISICCTFLFGAYLQATDTIRHPRPDGLFRDDVSPVGINVDSLFGLSHLPSPTDAESIWPRRVVERPTVLSTVDRIVTDKDEFSYLLDGDLGLVVVVNAEGELVKRFALPSRYAPSQPLRSIAVSGSGRIYVGSTSGVVGVFQRVRDSISFVRQFDLGYTPEDMCAFDQLLVVHGWMRESQDLIHVYGADGHNDRSFGRVYDGGTWLVNRIVNRGRLACDELRGTIAFAPNGVIGTVKAYDRKGKIRWISDMRGFHPIGVTTHAGQVEVRADPSGFDQLVALIRAPNDLIIAQIARLRLRPGSKDSAWSVTTIAYRASTGQPVSVTANARVLLALSERVAWVRERPIGAAVHEWRLRAVRSGRRKLNK